MIINSNKVIIEYCQNMSVDLSATNSTDSKIKRIMTSIREITLFSHTNQFVSATIREKFKKLFNRDYVFHSANDNRLNLDDDILFHIVNANFFCVNIKNATNNSIVIFRRNRLRVLQKYENDDCYLISSKNAHLATDKWSTHTTKLTMRTFLTTSAENNQQTKQYETTLVNEITIYESNETTSIFQNIAKKYFTLWKNDDKIINISAHRWMQIKFKSNAKITAVKVYSLEFKEKKNHK